MTALLQATGLSAGYNGQPVVRDLDVEVQPGEVVALFGPNGAGKTTTLLTLAGDLAPIAGEVMMDGKPAPSALHRRARNGLSFVTEERSVFMEMTVDENLRVARVDKARALELFPELEPLMNRRAGLLSGGEQQMLTLGRALARRPRLLMVDELSLGLAPLIVRRLLQALRTAADGGIGVLLVEQHVDQALKQADRVYVMERGLVILKGPKSEVADRVHEIEASYLGAAGGHKISPESAQ
jgi:ABC-type branched-subunit amino acid transport system ATPase component